MPDLPTMDTGGLTDHREFLQLVRDMISGQRKVGESPKGKILVFRLPQHQVLQHLQEARTTQFGTIGWDTETYYVEEHGTPIVEVGSPEEKIEFLSDIRNLVEQKRGTLAMDANEDLAGNPSRDYASPGGEKGHLLKEYDALLDHITHVHHRLRDRVNG
jgi:hypothetical protein